MVSDHRRATEIDCADGMSAEQSDLFVTSLIGVGDNVFERESDAEDRLTSLLRAISTVS